MVDEKKPDFHDDVRLVARASAPLANNFENGGLDFEHRLRGASAGHPSKQPLDDADIERIKDIASIQLEDSRTELERANAVAHAMSQRDEDSEVDNIKVDDDDEDSAWVDEDDEAVDDDAMKDFVSPKRNGDVSEYNLDTYDEEDDGPASIYDEPTEYLGPHHDLLLSSMPLCLEWLDYPVSSAGKHGHRRTAPVHVSEITSPSARLEPEIEIYSIDLLYSVYSDAVLGNPEEDGGTRPRTRRARRITSTPSSPSRGTAPCRQMLASGSADRTVKLWDLSRDPKEGALRSFGTLHMDKVQAVQWNPTDPAVLLSGSYDRTVRVFDSRAPDASVGAVVGADIESIRWDPSDNRWRTGWRSISTCGRCRRISTNRRQPVSRSQHMMAQRVHEDGTKRQVSLVAGRDLRLGEVFSAVWSPDDRLTLAAAGSKAKLQIWDVGANFGARKVFEPRLAEAGRKLRERTTGDVIGVADEEEDSDDDDE
ncbi:WD40-repeat-containing domain protein [Lactarius deliciosus]|nr:WD40-repeat-containing domain protein [Lactarius deliciosus]